MTAHDAGESWLAMRRTWRMAVSPARTASPLIGTFTANWTRRCDSSA